MFEPMRLDASDVRAWDEAYYAHVFVTDEEYEHRAVVRADGDFLELADGSRLLDFTSGLLCVNAGHRNERIRAAIVEALERYGFVWEGFATEYRSRAAKLIVEDLLGRDGWAGRVRFTSSGSEAVELALLIAKLVTGRPNVVSRDFAYHGWTHGALSLMGLPGSRGILASPDSDEVRRPAGIPMPGVHFAPAPYCTRCPISHTYPACKRGGETIACIEATEHLIRTIGADSIAAVVAEPIFGVGMFHPPPEYLPQLREVTRRHGILLIIDEVMTGFGRAGKTFAYQHSPGVTPDLMTIGKGMVSAALPAGGVVMSREIAAIMDRYRWETISTFAGHPVVMAAVVANLEWLIEERVPERAAELGAYLGAQLRTLQDTHACVGDVNGAGLLWAVELVRPDGSGERFVPDDRHVIPTGEPGFTPSFFVAAECAKRGVALATAPPNTLRLGPPLNTTREHIDLGITALSKALAELDRIAVPAAAEPRVRPPALAGPS
jgi:taurine---2-oxoglutarate transaminase